MTIINNIIIKRKIIHLPIGSCFFEKYLEIFPKLKEYGFISETFDLNLCNFVALTKRILLPPL